MLDVVNDPGVRKVLLVLPHMAELSSTHQRKFGLSQSYSRMYSFTCAM